MKVVAAIMVLIGFAIGAGAVLEMVSSGPGATQFWIAVFTTPAAVFFGVTGVAVWLRGVRVRPLALLAALLMCGSTVAATAFGGMGLPAALTGLIGSLVVIGWFWRNRNLPTTS